MGQLYIVDGLPSSINECVVLAQYVNRPSDIPDETVIVSWSSDSEPKYSSIDWIVTHAVFTTKIENEILYSEPTGRMLVNGVIEEIARITPSIDVFGFIRKVRTIGNSVFAVGMGRQVYVRRGANWQRFDNDMVVTPKVDEVVGLNSIAGSAEEELYAAGYGGEIWHYSKRSWLKSESPTNIKLNDVCFVSSNEIYICGQLGTLVKGYFNRWKVLDVTNTDDEFWSMEWFKGKLYLASLKGIYRLEGEHLEEVHSGKTYGRLHSCVDSLWSFGSDFITRTGDGVSWKNL